MKKSVYHFFAVTLIFVGTLTLTGGSHNAFSEKMNNKADISSNMSGYHEGTYTKLLYKKKRYN